ncbi:hypothetical protein PSTG_06558 [Puccinia striiformis f. sp. tritici PST-78]|uniref:Uncharacterized protein n=1 Tax=Puccinia striiformis f. sp. tritici PST-78 TaxID=1165861 RepID=A0A0L0VLI4_9BASI|nr:hypothetical protein PSTG_06558 [Puccinia striiformis f. sp. tritici PST-78]
MFLETRALVVYGALLSLVMGSMAISPRARLARRMTSAVIGGEKELVYGKGTKIFADSLLDTHPAGPKESGLTLMQFKQRGVREMKIDPKDMDRFNDDFFVVCIALASPSASTNSRSAHWDEAVKNDKFQLQKLYNEHMGWVLTSRDIKGKRVEALKALWTKGHKTYVNGGNPEISLRDYYFGQIEGKILTPEENQKFIQWRLEQQWAYRRFNIPSLLDKFMEWAAEDAKLKNNMYVLEYNKGLGKESKTIIKLSERLKQSSLHWRNILRSMKNWAMKSINMVRKGKPE